MVLNGALILCSGLPIAPDEANWQRRARLPTQTVSLCVYWLPLTAVAISFIVTVSVSLSPVTFSDTFFYGDCDARKQVECKYFLVFNTWCGI